jgi:hypothetical protein
LRLTRILEQESNRQGTIEFGRMHLERMVPLILRIGEFDKEKRFFFKKKKRKKRKKTEVWCLLKEKFRRKPE